MPYKIAIGIFVSELVAALERKDGYIMGSRGQNPRTGYLDLSETKCKSSWEPNGWYYSQYDDSASKHDKALYWRKHCTRVWDCNGMAEGIYEIHTGVNIDSKARYNYSEWCDPKGKGMIPANYRVPGAAVFWSNSNYAADIHHVAYLVRPVDSSNPSGDWYIIEAKGVMYGVVESRLYSRKPNYWGLMTKYFDYSDSGEYKPVELHLGDRLLKNGCEGNDVKELQNALIRLGYDCGKWGADGDFGDATEMAVRRFQTQYGLAPDGEFGPLSFDAMEKALSELEKPVENPEKVEIVGGDCYVRETPGITGDIVGVCRCGTEWPYGKAIDEESKWLSILYKGNLGWVSPKYGRLVK